VTRTRGRIAIAAAAAAGALFALALALGHVDVPDPAAGLSSASSSLGEWAYLAVPALAFLETAAFVGLLVPGETAVVVGGVVAERGDVALPAMIALVWLGAMTGDLVSFGLGRRLGRPFLDAHGARLRIRPEHVERVEHFFGRYGGRAVLVGRFVEILRALTPFVAGASRLPLRRFLPYSVLGALGWAATFTVVGYVFASSFETAGEAAGRIALGGAVLVAVALVLAARSRRPRRAISPSRNLTQRPPAPFLRHERNAPLHPNGQPDRRAAPGRRRPGSSRPAHAGGPHRGVGPS
jgi:membrane-associated protein